MTFTITPGWWIVPLVLTILAASWVWLKADTSPASGYSAAGQAAYNAIVLLFGLVIVLLVWLIYMVIKT